MCIRDSFNANGGFVSIECRYDFSTGGGALNINEVEFHFGAGYSIYGCYVTSYVSNGNTYVPGSAEWAADCNLVTLSYMGNTENTTIRLRLTIGILDAPSTCLLYTSPSPRDRTRSRMPSSAWKKKTTQKKKKKTVSYKKKKNKENQAYVKTITHHDNL